MKVTVNLISNSGNYDINGKDIKKGNLLGVFQPQGYDNTRIVVTEDTMFLINVVSNFVGQVDWSAWINDKFCKMNETVTVTFK